MIGSISPLPLSFEDLGQHAMKLPRLLRLWVAIDKLKNRSLEFRIPIRDRETFDEFPHHFFMLGMACLRIDESLSSTNETENLSVLVVEIHQFEQDTPALLGSFQGLAEFCFEIRRSLFGSGELARRSLPGSCVLR